ncbi:GtrA family protein [Bifidobacterium adolescentis]|nr:GtrA family protein [Bifidobacterium adolescentis]MDB1522687.1 GtrA family protein [Bifidobacterium adolescentis]MDB1536745.1 GtrA family protein [Bifidobacterium adolescentis]
MPTDGKPKNGIVRQLFSYGGVSAMQTFVEFGVFAVLQLAGLPFRLANAVAVFCSGSFNYVMNRNVTFKSSSNYARSIAMFVAMYCWNLLFSNLMMAWTPDCSAGPPWRSRSSPWACRRSGASCCAATSSSNDVRAGRFSRRDHGKTDMLSYNGCASGNLWLREGRDAVGGCKTGNGTAPARV